MVKMNLYRPDALWYTQRNFSLKINDNTIVIFSKYDRQREPRIDRKVAVLYNTVVFVI